jgi:fatty acid-binding protein DegV
LLQAKPILSIRNGCVGPFESQRTKHRALARFKEFVFSQCPLDGSGHLCVMHGENMDDPQGLPEEFSKVFGVNIPLYYLPPAILVHGSPGTVSQNIVNDDIPVPKPLFFRLGVSL